MSLLSPTFTAQLNTKFRTALDETDVAELELVKVENRPAPSGYESFSLRFLGPPNMPAIQRSYSMDHDHIGNVEIFLVPLSADQAGVVFEAVFNRFLED